MVNLCSRRLLRNSRVACGGLTRRVTLPFSFERIAADNALDPSATPARRTHWWHPGAKKGARPSLPRIPPFRERKLVGLTYAAAPSYSRQPRFVLRRRPCRARTRVAPSRVGRSGAARRSVCPTRAPAAQCSGPSPPHPLPHVRASFNERLRTSPPPAACRHHPSVRPPCRSTKEGSSRARPCRTSESCVQRSVSARARESRERLDF